MAKVNFIRNYARKNLMKATDEGIMVIPNTQKVDFQEAMLKQLLIENGINPDAIKSEGAMNEAMAFINQSQKTKPPSAEAKVFDLKGDRLDPRQNIMGGTQEESIKKNIAEATKKGDFTGIANQALRDPDIARKFMLSKKFPFRREENVRSGADAIPLARKAEFDEEMKMKDMAKERDYSVEQLVSDFKKFGNATDKDIQTIIKSGKMGQIPYVMDNYGMSYTEVLDTLKRGKPLIEGMAQGGRIGLKDGMDRRTFMKIMGGLAAVPIVGKFFKLSKVGQTVKKVPMIKTDDVAGKPEWFDALVNKVIAEGDDVTKKFATGERQSIHQKTLDDGSVVRVTEDVDDGAVRVEYQSEQNVFGDDVQLQYKKPLPDEGNPNPSAEFTTAESGPVGRGGRSPDGDDYEIDVDEVGGSSIKDLDSDVSKLKEYATGKKPTMQELVQNIERRKKAQRITDDPEAQSDAVIRRQGEMLDDQDFASGGIARLLGE